MTADITIVGLGPGPAELRTVAAQRALDAAERVFIRDHEGADFSDLLSRENVIDLKTFRDPAAPHGERWRSAATAIVEAAAEGPVVLAIPGHPRFGEMLTVETISLARDRGLSIDVIDGLSMIDLLCTALDIDPVRERVQLVDGRDLSLLQHEAPFNAGLLRLTPTLPILITHVYSNEILRALSDLLAGILPGDHQVTTVKCAGLPSESRETLTLAELAEHEGDPMMGVFIPALAQLDATRAPETLQHIVARLRREDGCPWDRKQTTQSLRGPLIDELYEVIDAIDAGDDANLAEELGDLLMLILMHTQIATERGAFTLDDVHGAINAKLIRRHPHVFGDLAANDADEVVGLWQRVKAQEKAEQPTRPEKAADGQPYSMPALDRAARVLKKHPISVSPEEPDHRQQALFEAVAAVVAAGDDPNNVLRTALFSHVERAEAGA